MRGRTITHHSPIYKLPNIGRRTGNILYRAGVKTVGHFIKLPDMLLAESFGPTLPVLRRRAERMLLRASQREFVGALEGWARRLMV